MKAILRTVTWACFVTLALGLFLVQTAGTPTIAKELPVVDLVDPNKVDIPAELQWKPKALETASALMSDVKDQYSQTLLTMKNKGASYLEVYSDGNEGFGTQIAREYPDYANFNSAWTINGFTAWGQGVTTISVRAKVESKLASQLGGFAPGGCRLLFDFWNWNTWFAKDCKVVVASGESLLRASLIEFVQTIRWPQGEYFDVAEALELIATSKYDYEVVNSQIVCPSLFDIGYRAEPIPLYEKPRPPAAGQPTNLEGTFLTGYRISIDPKQAWVFKLDLLGLSAQELADRVEVVESPDAVKFNFSL